MTAQTIKAGMNLILWQDLDSRWKPCWTIRDSVRPMPSDQRALWANLFQQFVYTHLPNLPNTYNR